jgi:hypothetical protein
MSLSIETQRKREELDTFIKRALAPYAAIQGVVGIGSIATGHAHAGSDIDALVFLDPLDLYVVPAEFIWLPSDSSFHSIFSREEAVQETGIQFDLVRVDLRQWSDPSFEWPEGRRAELYEGWMAFDRTGKIARLLAERLTYSDEICIMRLDEAITWMDQHLSDDQPEQGWDSLGPAIAHDRLQAAYDYLVQALFAYNRRWRPWRNREMSYLLALPWLPTGFAERVLPALNAPSLNRDGYVDRVEILRLLFADLLTQLVAEGVYAEDPIGESFARRHAEPGRAWNMDEWNARHRQRPSC